MEIKFQAVARCVDGIGGKVSHVLINQRSWKISFLVVKEEKNEGDDWLVPIHYLESASGAEVWLRCTVTQLRRFERFTEYAVPSDQLIEDASRMAGLEKYAALETTYRQSYRLNVPAGNHLLYWGTQVGAADGQVGEIDAVRFDTKHFMLAAIVFRLGAFWFKKALVVPSHKIERIDRGFVYLNVDRSQIEAQPEIPPQRP